MEFGNGFVGAVHDSSRNFIYASIAAIELAMLDKHPSHDLSWKNDIKLPPNMCGCIFMIDLNQRASAKDPNSALMKALVCGVQVGDGTCDNDSIAHPGELALLLRPGRLGEARRHCRPSRAAAAGQAMQPLAAADRPTAHLPTRRQAGVRRGQRPAAHIRAGRPRPPGER
jgi:hypothetical protein